MTQPSTAAALTTALPGGTGSTGPFGLPSSGAVQVTASAIVSALSGSSLIVYLDEMIGGDWRTIATLGPQTGTGVATATVSPVNDGSRQYRFRWDLAGSSATVTLLASPQ